MLTLEKIEFIKNEHILEQLNNEKKILYFDIETSGLSTKFHDIYMIGTAYQSDLAGNYKIIQWFNDDGKSEYEILKEFLSISSDFDILAHYNGDTFDIPFIAEKCKQYELNFAKEKYQSLDLYKLIKHLKNFLKVVNMKQKSIEEFLGMHRKDQYDGGQLIQVYKDYLKQNRTDLKESLLLHNHDDIIGLISIQNILPYLFITEGKFKTSNYTFINDNELIIDCESDYTVSVPLSLNFDGTYIKISDNKVRFLLQIYNKELKHFYKEYKDYYYLVDEDYAIHKSVALFVDKNHRVKCSKDNCYIKKQSYFIKQYTSLFEPEFKENSKDSVSFFECNKKDFESVFSSSNFHEYLYVLIKKLL